MKKRNLKLLILTITVAAFLSSNVTVFAKSNQSEKNKVASIQQENSITKGKGNQKENSNSKKDQKEILIISHRLDSIETSLKVTLKKLDAYVSGNTTTTDGTQTGTGATGGDGTQTGTGATGGDGTQTGTGAISGDGTQTGTGATSGDGTQTGTDATSGDGTQIGTDTTNSDGIQNSTDISSGGDKQTSDTQVVTGTANTDTQINTTTDSSSINENTTTGNTSSSGETVESSDGTGTAGEEDKEDLSDDFEDEYNEEDTKIDNSFYGKLNAINNRLNTVERQLSRISTSNSSDLTQLNDRAAKLREQVKTAMDTLTKVQNQNVEKITKKSSKKTMEEQKISQDKKTWKIHFTKALNEETVNSKNIMIVDSSNNVVDADMSYDKTNQNVVIQVDDGFKKGETYTILIGDGVQSAEGKNLPKPVVKSFTVN